MSNPMFKMAFEGASAATGAARGMLNEAIAKYGEDAGVGYPGTAYTLPVIHALSGVAVKQLKDITPVLDTVIANFIKDDETQQAAQFNGVATFYAAEIIEALGYMNGVNPFEGNEKATGFLPDSILRALGISLVDGTIPGVAVIMGKARSNEEAAALIKNLQSKGMLIVLANEVIDQLFETDTKVGAQYLTVPLGTFTQIIHVVNFALRAGLAFGGVAPGATFDHVGYQQKRMPAFVLMLGEIDIIKASALMGCNLCTFPIICDTPVKDEIADQIVYEPDYNKMVQIALELRGIKLKIVDIDVPITIGPAFEGETIRKSDSFIEMGGGRTEAFELVQMVGADDIEDGKVTVIGPEIDEFKEGDKTPFGLIIKIYGRKMQQDFEGVLERRVHYFINYGEGLWHVAQRDICWLRISKQAAANGFKLKHYGDILVAKYKSEFPAIVDRVEVLIYTDPAEVSKLHEEAKRKYKARDDRMGILTDDSVEEFYSCTLCQSFAPNHCCVVSPERVGLCGAVSWLDAKASYEITPTGPNQPIIKGEAIDDTMGKWSSVNEFVASASHGSIEEVSLYTLMEQPMTSCGCFEAIMAIVPEANGIMLTTREHSGMTPCGMSFSTLAGTVGGGVQSPGFMGIGKRYILSKKFIKADGGIKRIVWMPKSLKDEVRTEFSALSEALGLGADYIDKIADETIGISGEEILSFLEEKNHPALALEPLM